MNFLPSHDNHLTQPSLFLLRPMTSWRWPTGRSMPWLMRWGENWASARPSSVESRRLMCGTAQTLRHHMEKDTAPTSLPFHWHVGCQSTCRYISSQMECFGTVVSATCFCALVNQTSWFRILLKKMNNFLCCFYSACQRGKNITFSFHFHIFIFFIIFFFCNNDSAVP